MSAIYGYQNLSDCHNHSSNSYDGNDSVADMCRKAAALGLLHYTLTDHCECNEYDRETRDYRSVVISSYRDMQRVRDELKMNILFGIELGQPLHNLEAAEDALNGRNYDFVLGSVHGIKNMEDFYFWDTLGLDVDTALARYFGELLETATWGKFDSLGHLTYPLRYIVGDHGISVNMNRHLPAVREIYRVLIERGIALEVNTSGLRQKIGETLPNEALLRLYKDCGGELLTLGSDAHSCKDLGKGIAEGMALLEHIGYTHYTVFKNRKPTMIEIE